MRPEFFPLVDLRDFFSSDLGSGGGGGGEGGARKINSENDQFTPQSPQLQRIARKLKFLL